MSEFFPNGIAESIGDDLVTTSPYQTSGSVWFVCSVNGVNAASPAGRDKEKPLATLAQAQTNASAGDTVVLLNGHTETYVGALTITKKLYICGCGQSSGKPGVSFLINSAGGDVLIITAAGTQLRSIYFPASVQSNSGNNGGKVTIQATDCLVRGCYFEMSGLDQMAAVFDAGTANTRLRVQNCTFISTATVVATRPLYGLRINTAATDIEITGCTFSDGTVGFATAACDTSGVTLTTLRIENTSLLSGADMLLAAATTYRLNGGTFTGGGRIQFL